ncbi:DUF6194 family protein [Deinococcus sp.]|uniref:DUF6194 family protein n=1 Tax=Deinococcus sp. TaxID=47478 RepID=UPI0025F03534|nr:DUF6194 family protein [Deinococcus sp.]
MLLTEYQDMNEHELLSAMREQFPNMLTQVADGDSFFFVPGEAELMFPFATLIRHDDAYEVFSQLNRPGVYRLNMGVGKARLRALVAESGHHDFTALDTLMPHPTYGPAGWLCILNPGAGTFETLRTLLATAYGRSEQRAGRRATIDTPDS